MSPTRSLGQFFRGKRGSNGQPIKRADVLTPTNKEILRYVDIGSAAHILHCATEENGYRGDPVRLFLRLAQECRAAGLPKRYAGGAIVIWLKLCMGYDL